MLEKKMSQMKMGEIATVEHVDTNDVMKRRLFELGLIVGTKTKCVLMAQSGGMLGFDIRGAIIALRKSDLDRINVQLN